MITSSGYLKQLLGNFKILRKKVGLSEAALEEKLILGPGWISRFEDGETIPTIDILLAMLHQIDSTLEELIRDLSSRPDTADIERYIFAKKSNDDLTVHFRYANFDAKYKLPGGTLAQFEIVIKTLRDGLARLVANEAQNEALKADAVARAFLTAVKLWPGANPSDLWWFVIYRAYCDPYNHPARYARLDLTQSWKRTGGWALEEVLVRHYGPFLKKHQIRLFIPAASEKQAIVRGLNVGERIESDKIDVVLMGVHNRKEKFFGVVHVKASFAERRTDDVPMSIALVKHGFTSPLWTMDCKSVPGATPLNRGELGDATKDRRSAKRKDIEDEGYFSGCFSYNKNTVPSAISMPAARRIYVCNFRNPKDAFSQFILRRWKAFRSA